MPVPPISPELIVAAGTKGIKTFAGIGQFFAGRKALKAKRPDYEIMPEFTKNVELGQGVKGMGMAPEVYDRGNRDIQRNALFGLNALGDRRGVTAGIGNIVQRMNDATTNLNAEDARIRNQNYVTGTQMESQANQNLAMQKIAKMYWDKLDPYQAKIASGQAMMGAGLSNVMGGLDDIGSIFMMNKMNKDANGKGI